MFRKRGDMLLKLQLYLYITGTRTLNLLQWWAVFENFGMLVQLIT